MRKLIDVIIPMFNREEYIPNIIQCLEKQTMKEFRAVFVDDGSVDNTYESLKMQLKQASFSSIVLKQENRGAAAARNFGLSVSDANWTVFVDSDDSILPQYLEYLYNAVCSVNADIGVCRFEMVPVSADVNEWNAEKMDATELTAAECMKGHYTEWIAPVCMIVSRELRVANDLKFDENCVYCEDIPFITQVIEASSKAVKLNNVLYLYRVHQGSLSRSPKFHKFLSGIECFQRVEKQLECSQTEASAVFRAIGCARYYIATFRKAAVQMSYEDFLKLTEIISFAIYKKQLMNIPAKQRVAGYLLLFSKRVFYYTVRVLFND